VRFTLFYILLSLCLLEVCAQEELHSRKRKSIESYNQARDLVALQQLSEAVTSLESAIARDGSFDEAIVLLNELYLQLNRQADAEKLIEQSSGELETGFSDRAFYDLALSFWQTGQYQKAGVYIEKIQGEVLGKSDESFDLLARSIAFSLESVSTGLPVLSEVLKSPLNEYDMQYFPSIDAAGELIFTARDKRWSGHEQIMISTDSAGFWTKPRLISEQINSDLNEGTAAISADGQTLVFTGCNRPQSFGSCDLFITNKVEGEWQNPQLLPENINSPYWESQPSLNARGDALYFVSTRPGLGG